MKQPVDYLIESDGDPDAAIILAVQEAVEGCLKLERSTMEHDAVIFPDDIRDHFKKAGYL